MSYAHKKLTVDDKYNEASAANVVYGRHYTGCVDDGKASRVLVDAADKSSTVLET